MWPHIPVTHIQGVSPGVHARSAWPVMSNSNIFCKHYIFVIFNFREIFVFLFFLVCLFVLITCVRYLIQEIKFLTSHEVKAKSKIVRCVWEWHSLSFTFFVLIYRFFLLCASSSMHLIRPILAIQTCTFVQAWNRPFNSCSWTSFCPPRTNLDKQQTNKLRERKRE